MKNYNYLSILVTGLLFCFHANAQKTPNAEDTPPKFVKFDGTKGNNKSFTLNQTQQVFKTYLHLSDKDGLKKQQLFRDNLGYTHEKYQQYYQGIKVEYSTYTIHAKNGILTSMNGDFKRLKDMNTSARLSAAQALQKAVNFTGAQEYMWQNASLARTMNYAKPQGELVIVANYATKDRERFMQPVLAYKFDVYATKPLSRNYVYVDAKTGEVVHTNAIIHHVDEHAHKVKAHKGDKNYMHQPEATGTAATRYSGSRTIETSTTSGGYRLRDNTRGNGVETYDLNNGTSYGSASDFVDNDNSWTAAEWDNAQKDNAGLDAHWGAEKTYDYFKEKFNRNSYDGNGATIKSYVHYSSNYVNAFWNGNVMTYGDGNSQYDPLTTVDIAAHEIGHAVCSNTANLVYRYESGALNESFSDIWGACVEFFAAPNDAGKHTWLMGEELGTNLNFRSIIDPKAKGDPDTYKGTNWVTGSSDNGGVHSNSGVQNHWFYILTVGKTGTNDNGDSYSVSGIGIEKAAQIAYRNETVYLSSNSQYADARQGAIQAAEDLYGAGSPEVLATTNAWYAVGVGPEACEGDCPLLYCTSNGQDVSDEYIGNVTLGSIDNTTGASSSGYADYTAISTQLVTGTSNTITVTPVWTGTIYNEAYRVWIDYNQDGDFGDSGETVWSKSSGKTTPVSGSFTVPDGAKTGKTRMRVSMKYNANPTPCESFQYGEVEDYTVDIQGASVAVAESNEQTLGIGIDTGLDFEFKVLPNPSENTLKINARDLSDDASITITNMSGETKTVTTLGKAKKGIDISSLPQGMYIIKADKYTKRLFKQ